MMYFIIAEGSAEHAIIDILLDNNKLFFDRDEILGREVYRLKYIHVAFRLLNLQTDAIDTLCIMDSAGKVIHKIPKEYKEKMISVTDYLTKPEIEVLYIIGENDYHDFINKFKAGKNREKPSVYCRKKYKGYKKDYNIWIDRWSNDVDGLIAAIKTYRQMSDGSTKTLSDLLK